MYSWPGHYLELSGQLHAPAALPHGKSLRYTLDLRPGEPQNWSGQRGKKKNLTPTRTRNLTIHSRNAINIVTASISSASMFISTGHRLLVNRSLHTEYEQGPPNLPGPKHEMSVLLKPAKVRRGSSLIRTQQTTMVSRGTSDFVPRVVTIDSKWEIICLYIYIYILITGWCKIKVKLSLCLTN
jgi:hypothetical protein